MTKNSKQPIQTVLRYDEFTAAFAGYIFVEKNVKKIYHDIRRLADNNINIIVVNSVLVYGSEHLDGVLRIINEDKKRSRTHSIKNIEIEFLARICCTNQISTAIKINELDTVNSNFVVILISKDSDHVIDVLKKISNLGNRNDDIILPTDTKRSFILDTLFKDKIKKQTIPITLDDELFVKFLVERASIALL